jgi:hypothetical protein
MTLSITCPVCDASFTPANDLRGKRAFCPSCGSSFLVAGAGVAKRNEVNRPAPACAVPERRFLPLWLLPLLLLLLLAAGALSPRLFTRGRHGPEPVARYDQPPAPAPNPQPPVNDPPWNPKEKRGPAAERAPPRELDSPRPQTFRVWRTAYFPTKAFQAFALAFSPDGTRLAAGGLFYTGQPNNQVQVRLWDVAGQKNPRTLEVRTPIGKDGLPVGLGFSPDGKTLFSCETRGSAGEVTLWDAATGESTNTFESPFQLHSFAVSRDGKTAVTNGTELWDVRTGKSTTLPARGVSLPASTAFSPDGASLASVRWDGKMNAILLWNLPDGKKTAALATTAEVVQGLAFSSDGKTLLAAGSAVTGKARTIEAWDVASGKKTSTFALGDGRPRGPSER